MLPWSADLAGRIDEHVLVSDLLRGNPLGDPHERPLWVQVPPGYDADAGHRYPTVYVIQGYTGHLAMWRNRSPFRRPFPELADAVLADPAVPPAIVVYADAWTAYGGSQFLDSPATGRYHSYLCEEVVAFVDARYPTIADRDHRAIMGKSSGGYGAMVTPMLRPDVFGALATHAGDALFECCYQFEFPKLAPDAARRVRGLVRSLLHRLPRPDPRHPSARHVPAGNLRLRRRVLRRRGRHRPDSRSTTPAPSSPRSGSVGSPWDPVRMAAQPEHAEALRSMRAVWIDAGTRDEWFLDLGATAFHRAVLAAGADPSRVAFELFDAGHGAIEYRYPLALEWLCRRLAA